MDKFGIQLYSLRHLLEQHGFDLVLEKVARAGYDCVEFAGFYGYSPEEVKNLLAKHNLEGISAHIAIGDIESSLPYIDTLGIKYVYIPYLDYEKLSGDEFIETVRKIKEVKKLLDKRGVVFGYHNHAHEYIEGGDKVQDLLTAVEGFTSEFDIFWAVAAGQSPTALMKKYGSALSAIHVKEIDNRVRSDAREFPNAIVGEGKSDTANVIALAKKMGIHLFILEVEEYPCDEYEYIEKSFANMLALAAKC